MFRNGLKKNGLNQVIMKVENRIEYLVGLKESEARIWELRKMTNGENEWKHIEVHSTWYTAAQQAKRILKAD